MQRVGWMEKGEQPNKQGKSAAAHTHADRRTSANDTKCGQIEKDARIFFRTTEKYKTRRPDEHRKSRSYCRTERLNCTKPVLGSQLSHKLRVRNAVPAQQGAPNGTLPPCGVRTFPPPCGIRKRPGGAFSRKAVADLFGQAMNGERAAAPAATGKTLQAFFMSALCAQKSLATCGSRLKREFS